jgi:hypothetical protein
MKHKSPKRISIEFDHRHLFVLVSALETYSRLQSGQIKMAMDEVYWDRGLTYDEGQYIENAIRFIAFPPNATRHYDGHGGFYDQYNNEYNDKGELIKESEEWKNRKIRPHLDHPNSSFGIGCKEMIRGTIAWEIKKTIEEYLHYERNDGYRDMGVDGDGMLNVSHIPDPKVLDPIILSSLKYWKPQKAFRIPQRYQDKMSEVIKNKQYDKAWQIVETAFKNKPLPKGNSAKIEEIAGTYYVVIEKPIKIEKKL